VRIFRIGCLLGLYANVMIIGVTEAWMLIHRSLYLRSRMCLLMVQRLTAMI